MRILKHIALFLFGIFLIIFGFRSNTDKTASQPPARKENTPAEKDLPVKPEKQEKSKLSETGKTRLEGKTPEKADGST